MPNGIKQVSDWLRQLRNNSYEVETGEEEMLVTIPTGGGRKQTVRISVAPSPHGEYSVLRLQSRACVATDYRLVNQLLEANAELSWGGFVLNRSLSPNVIDVTSSFVAEHLGPHTLLPAIERVGRLADQVEASVSGKDEF